MSYCKGGRVWHVAETKGTTWGRPSAQSKCGVPVIGRMTPFFVEEPTDDDPVCVACVPPPVS